MKTRFFDKNLFIEALHQLKAPAIICFAISAAVSIIMPIAIYSESSSRESIISFFNANIPLAAIIYIIAPLFTFYLFFFLFKRKSADLYHSLSAKTTTLYISFISAIIALLIIITIISCLLTCLSLRITFGYLPIITKEAVTVALNLIAGSVLMTSGCAIGCALSGKLFSAFAASFMILFYPRIFVYIIVNALKEKIDLIDTGYFASYLDNDFNAAAGAVFGGFSEYKTIIYSLILAVIYFVIGAVLMNKRKSEIAGKESLTKKAQVFFRVIFCMAFSVYAVAEMFKQDELDTKFTSTVIILFFVSVISYFLFEIATRHSLKTLKKAAFEFSYVIILNLLVFAGLNCAETYIKSYQPSADEVESIRLISTQTHDWVYSSSKINTTDKLTEKNLEILANTKIKNENIKEIVCRVLKNNISEELIDKFIQENYYPLDTNNNYIVIVAFESDDTTKYRKLIIHDYYMNEIIGSLAAESEFIENMHSLPKEIINCKINDTTFRAIETSPYYDKTNTNWNDLIDVFESYKVEFNQYPFTSLFHYYYGSNYIANASKLIFTDKQGAKYILPVDYSMPSTIEKIVDINMKAQKDNLTKAIEYIKKAEKADDNEEYYIEYRTFNTHSQEYNREFDVDFENIDKLVDYIQKNGLKKSKKSAIIVLNVVSFGDADDEICSAKFYMDTDVIDKYFIDTAY